MTSNYFSKKNCSEYFQDAYLQYAVLKALLMFTNIIFLNVHPKQGTRTKIRQICPIADLINLIAFIYEQKSVDACVQVAGWSPVCLPSVSSECVVRNLHARGLIDNAIKLLVEAHDNDDDNNNAAISLSHSQGPLFLCACSCSVARALN